VLRVNQIDVFRGKIQILSKVSLFVEGAEIVAVIGGNGAGKTTLLETVSGLLRSARGTIEIAGNRIDVLPPHKIVGLGVIQVPEGRKLFAPLSVLENLEMGSYLLKKAGTLDRVFTLFPLLKERENQLAGSLSGGEQQMLAMPMRSSLARALSQAFFIDSTRALNPRCQPMNLRLYTSMIANR